MSWWNRWWRRRAVRRIFGSLSDLPGHELLILGLPMRTELLNDAPPAAIIEAACLAAAEATQHAVEERLGGDAEVWT